MFFLTAVAALKQDQALLASYCDFCVKNQHADGLEKLLTLMRGEADDSGLKALLPYVEGELLLLRNQTAAGLDLFEKTETAQRKILFRMADRLGTNDR